MLLENQNNDTDKQGAMDELKRPLRYREEEHNLSEWEAARLNSKTWSMEQEWNCDEFFSSETCPHLLASRTKVCESEADSFLV